MATPIKFDKPISFESIDKLAPSQEYEGTRVYVKKEYTDSTGRTWSKGWYECKEVSTGVYSWVNVLENLTSYETVKLPIEFNSTGTITFSSSCAAYQIGNTVIVQGMVKSTSTSSADSVDIYGFPTPVSQARGILGSNSASFGNATIDEGTDKLHLSIATIGVNLIFNFSYITNSYTPVIPVYDHSPVDGETLVYDGANSRWKLGPATTYMTNLISYNDFATWGGTESSGIVNTFVPGASSTIYQTGNMLEVTVVGTFKSTATSFAEDKDILLGVINEKYRPLCANYRFTVAFNGVETLAGWINPQGRLCAYSVKGSVTVPTAGIPVRCTFCYYTNTYSPALPAFSRTPQDGDILQFDGTNNKWDVSQDYNLNKTFSNLTITNAATDKGAIVWNFDKSYYLTMGAFRQLYIGFEVTEDIPATGECRIGTWSNKPGANDKFGAMVSAPCTLYTNQNSDQWPAWVNLQTGAMYVNTGTPEHPHPVPKYNLYHIHGMWIPCPEKI